LPRLLFVEEGGTCSLLHLFPSHSLGFDHPKRLAT
jgi:hypothetical protein